MKDSPGILKIDFYKS